MAKMYKILHHKITSFTCVVLLMVCTSNMSSAFNENTTTIRFSDLEGLPRNIITCYISDEFGYGWIGTGNGIARFDGYDFITYEVFEGRLINSIITDKKNQIWIGADNGLYLYNRIHDSFSLIYPGYIKQLLAFDENIYFLLQNRLVIIDSNGNSSEKEFKGINSFFVTKKGIWINTGNTGARCLNTSEVYLPKRVISLIKAIEGKLFLACRNGDLFVLLPSGKLKKIKVENRDHVRDIELINNELWLATDGNGILILDEKYQLIKHLKKEQGKTSQIPSNSIYDISKGLNESVWISTYGAGLFCLIPENQAFKNIVPEPGIKQSLVDKEGVSAYVNNDFYYLGTNYGLSRWNTNDNSFYNIGAEELQKYLQGNKVTALTTDKENVWIGTYDGLLGKFDTNLNFIQAYHPCSEQANEMQRIIFLFDYDADNILIGTQFQNNNFIRWNKTKETFDPIELEVKSESPRSFPINSLRRNRNGELIALVRNLGIFRYNPGTNNLEIIEQEINNRVTFKLNDFYHDSQGNYWFTTQANGLIRLSPDGLLFDKWTTEHGFPTNSLLRIESIDGKKLWITTIVGLCSFDIESKQIQIFNYRHGLASNEFAPRTSFVTSDNKIVLGHSEGFSVIAPKLLNPDSTKSKVIISDISFHNQSIKHLQKEKLLNTPLEEVKKIVLPYNRNSFSIRFFTKDNYLPKFNNFAYRLVGMEEEWIHLGANNQTNYTNLAPGKYVFQVKSTNKSNVWNKQHTSLELEILPPWYLTYLAFASYLLFVILNVVFVMRFYKRRVQLKKEVEISEYKVKKEHELTENKLAFFTNISHDLKTPLTLISAPINDLLVSDNLNTDQKKKLDVVKRNASRLYKLISDLIDFRKITQRQLPLQVQLVDLKPVVENIFESFRIECKKRDLDFSFNYLLNENVYADSKKVEKILWNLLANAIKFTPDSGKVWLHIESLTQENKKLLRLEIGDTGKGMNEMEKDRIFNRYYQIRKSDSIKFDGSGIGLSIVNDLVELHRGKISVETEPEKGSKFTVLLPAEKQAYSNDELFSEQTLIHKGETKDDFPGILEDKESLPDLTGKKYNLPKLLIVEDNMEMLEYLISHFKQKYKVYTAKEGNEGLTLAIQKEPDLIITDVQMPVMDGMVFSKNIRENYNLSHTPILMLTAASATEKKIEGLQSGADTYVTKPFEIEYLDAVAQSLLNNRKRAKEKFLGIEQIKENPGKYSSGDIEFINKLKSYIFENITNENLNIESLSQHFAISRTQLNRKIKALTNTTPNNYIRTIRLKKAYELIKNQNMRVSEAAYSTGFTDPNYFTYCFKKEFGYNPSKI